MQVKGLGVAGKAHITISDAYIYDFSPQIFPWFQILMCFVTPRGSERRFSENCWTRHEMVIQGIFVSIFSFLTPIYSKNRSGRTFLVSDFGVFWPQGGLKSEFRKSLNTPWDDHTRHICTNFQLSNPYLFRKTALDGNFWIQISGFWTPRGVKKANFGKLLNTPLDDDTRHICIVRFR